MHRHCYPAILWTATELDLCQVDGQTQRLWVTHVNAVHHAGGPANGAEAITAVLESQSDYFRCAPSPVLLARHAVPLWRACWLASS